MVALTALTLTCTVILGNHFFSPQIHFNYINITVCFFSYFKKGTREVVIIIQAFMVILMLIISILLFSMAVTIPIRFLEDSTVNSIQSKVTIYNDANICRPSLLNYILFVSIIKSQYRKK